MRAKERAKKLGVSESLHHFLHFHPMHKDLRGIAAALVDSPYDLTIYSVDSQKRLDAYLTVLPFSNQLDGLIIVTLPVDDASLRRLQQSAIPTLLIENRVAGFASIEIDNYYGGKLAAEHFISKGHERCAYVGDRVLPEYTLRPEDARLDGYRQTLLQEGLSLPDEYIKLPAFPPRDPSKQVHELLNLPNPPTAIFAATDNLALHVLKVAQQRGVRIPEDLALIGFDDIDIAEYLELTTISQSLEESGRLAVEHLITQIAEPSRPINNTLIQLKLIDRGTT